MPSRRIVVPTTAGAVVLAAVVAAVALLRSGEEAAAPGGDLIAYSCHEPGNPWFAVCVMRSDGTEKRRLTSRLTTTDPAWSPDARRIAFTRNEEVGEYTTFTDDDVYVMDADGDDPRQLTPEKDGRSSDQPTWSPDGTRIAFVEGSSVATQVPSRFGDLLVIAADGSNPRLLLRGPVADPAWSPDGSAIAYTLGSDLSSPTDVNMDLWVVEVDSGERRQLTRTPHLFETAAAWSPDGSRLAFARWTNQTSYDGKAAIFVVGRDGAGEKLVLQHRHFAAGPRNLAWSPDGRTIAIETSPFLGCSVIALVDVSSGRVRPLTSCTKPSESAFGPAWQPAGDGGRR